MGDWSRQGACGVGDLAARVWCKGWEAALPGPAGRRPPPPPALSAPCQYHCQCGRKLPAAFLVPMRSTQACNKPSPPRAVLTVTSCPPRRLPRTLHLAYDGPIL